MCMKPTSQSKIYCVDDIPSSILALTNKWLIGLF